MKWIPVATFVMKIPIRHLKNDFFWFILEHQVDDLKAKLASQEAELKLKNEDADKLIQIVGVETEKVSKEKAIADDEEKKVAAINLAVSKKARECEEDLAKAEPALKAAQEALNTLNKVPSFFPYSQILFERFGLEIGVCHRYADL